MAPSEFLRSQGNLGPEALADVRRIVNRMGGSVGISISAAFVNGIGEAVKKIPAMGQALAATLEADIRQSDRREANLALAQGAQRAVLESYQGRQRLYTPNGQPDPRAEGRYGPGVLADALGDPDMVAGTTRSRISFINTEALDAEAPHYARLNWGAGGNASSRGAGLEPGRFDLEFVGPQGGRQTVGILAFGSMVRPAMKIPAHFWDEEGFFHVGRKPKGAEGSSGGRMAVGARGAQFFDAGLRYVAAHAGEEYLVMLNNLLRDPKAKRSIEAKFGKPISATNLRNLR